MKSTVFCITSSLLFALVMNSRAEAVGFDFPPVPPDEGHESLWLPSGERITFLKTTENTGGKYTLANFYVPPGEGPIPHIHHNENEWFYVTSGELQIQMGDNIFPVGVTPGINAPKENLHTINVTPGTLVYGPKDHLHGFKNIGKTPATMLIVWAPSGIEKYFEGEGVPVIDPSKPPPFDPEKLSLFVSSAPKYGIDQSSYPEEYVSTVENDFNNMDNHAEELLALLDNNSTPVPESSSAWGLLVFGAFVAISILKRKHKLTSKVRLVLTNFVVNRFCRWETRSRSAGSR